MDVKALARKAAGSSEITEGRSKWSTEEIISKYPNGITVHRFDMFQGDNGPYAVWNFAEEPKAYYMGGTILTNFAKALIDEAGDLVAAVKELDEQPVKIKLIKTKTRTGRDCTVFEVVD